MQPVSLNPAILLQLPLPQELNAMTREVENLKKVVDEASRKKKAPPNFENAKIYLSYMSQVR